MISRGQMSDLLSSISLHQTVLKKKKKNLYSAVKRLGVQSTLYYTAQETGTGNGTLVTMYKGGSNTGQEGGTDPFPVVVWRSAAL